MSSGDGKSETDQLVLLSGPFDRHVAQQKRRAVLNIVDYVASNAVRSVVLEVVRDVVGNIGGVRMKI